MIVNNLLATNEQEEWYPFKNKEQLQGLLLLGTTRNLTSCAEYDQVRAILRILEVKLNDWGVLRDLRNRLKDHLGLHIVNNMSVLCNPCYGLSIKEILTQELSNPLTVPHLVFFPECDVDVVIDRFLQSKKWRECLDPHL
ncbi:hypothetical protein CROQUDRAFT_52060 [Cronartium quercuum f. sp. fusiforme G11]|uniref:Uncharacterized protein n=1 Tax=Cronartium quercuum f. sp. fusiforme G11 TaxID=708437 RepID=A0A9P6NBL1_9BASI|nr:hypothetical protein CROQUDRAFT_52060 [Cronartium quercuum f. sp. fusiforme G11]